MNHPGRVIVSVLVTLLLILVGTIVYLVIFTSYTRAAAISIDVIWALTLYNPLYWVIVVVVVSIMVWLSRRWLAS
jgi:membrane protein implicated in regulation of membrane protease activity